MLRAYAAGVIVVVAPDNEMAPDGIMADPAGLNGVVTVGRHDINGALPESLTPNGEYLTVVAPGVDLRAPTVVDGSWERYALVDGNSYSTPWTAGVLALAWSLHPEATANQMIQALIRTTATTPEGGEPTHDDQFGYGPVSVPRLLAVDPTTFPDDNPLLHPLDDADAHPSTEAILEATGKAVPEETAEPTPEPTTPPADTGDDQADDDAESESAALPLPAILGGAAVLLAAAITTAVLLRRRTTRAATSTSPTREEA
jgi:subtilisin family serine protease